MTDFLDSARREIESRLADMREEVKRLETAAAALAGGRGANARKRPGRPRRTTQRSTSGGRTRGRRAGGGTRATQASRLVQRNPGITIAELAKKMGITPNYLYRVMPQLEKDGKVRKQGKGWHPAG